YYFDGDEWDKDIWDRRNLPIPEEHINPSDNEYIINFSDIKNSYFKDQVKRYCKLRINTTRYSYVIDIARTLRLFFNFLIKRNPNIKRIKQITRLDIEEYISEINSRGYSPRTVTGYLSIVRT